MMPNVLFLCMLGLSFLHLVSCHDCLAKRTLPVYVNISDNATFSMQAHESERVYRVEVRLLVGGFRKLVFAIHLYDWQKPLPSPYDQRYLDRVVFSADQNVTDGLRDFNVTIVDIQSDDNGTYIVQKHPRLSNGTCFIVYVLGQPVVSASVSPTVTEEGNSGHLMCSTTSTTVPASHNLTMLVSWYIGGQFIATTGRYRVDNNILSIYSMTRADDGLVVECQAREDKGLTTWANMSITVNWGPDLGLILQPSKTFYHIDVGKTLPSIRCSADCKPVCQISWAKAESGLIVSTNGLLSLGPVTEDKSGEYVCTATREGTYKQASKSISILLKEKKENVTQAMAVVGVGLSVASLLLAVGVVIFLFRQTFCTWKCRRVTGKESTAEDSASQNRAYEDLKGTRVVQETYDALALGTFDDSSTRDQDTRNAGVYENNRLN